MSAIPFYADLDIKGNHLLNSILTAATVTADPVINLGVSSKQYVDAETTRAEGAESTLNDSITGALGAISTETTRAEAAELTTVNKTQAIFSPLNYGAVGNGIADDTAALQSCIAAAHAVNGIVDLGYYTYNTTSPLSIVTGLVIRGAGLAGGTITNSASSLFSITGSKSNWAILDCTLTASGGHVFDCTSAGTTVSSGKILNATITQANASYGIWYMPNGNYLNMLVGDGCFITAPSGCTTPPWYIVSGSGGVASANANTWRQMTVVNSLNETVPFFYIESVSTHTTSFSFNSDLVFRDITAEECSGGIFQGMSVANVTIDGVSGYDASYYGHVFSVGTSATGLQPSRNIIVRNSGRRDGGLSTGIYDFYASTDTLAIILENVGPADSVTSPVAYNTPLAATAIVQPPNIQFLTSSGTWTKPLGAQVVDVILCGSGAGGGSGRQGAASTVRCGGGPGGAAGYSARKFAASDLTATVTVTVATAPNGGAAVTTADTNGNNGTSGGPTSFGGYLFANGGNAGSGGTATTGTAGLGGLGTVTGGSGANASTSGGASIGSSPAAGCVAGAAGGGITSGNVAGAGGAGAVSLMGGQSAGTAGAVDSTTPTSGTAPSVQGTPAGSPGSGAASITTAAQGGANGNYGAGGAGGGASLDGNNSGAGGKGGPGFCLVITYFQ